MSRCTNPKDCDCAETDNLEYLKCGPCQKCKRRAEVMASAMSQSLDKEDGHNTLDKLEMSSNKICTVQI